jgi:zona occludens toxin
MAITAYTGLPGSGKSYNVVANVIIPAIKQNREVWTNIPVFNDKLQADFGGTVTFFDLDDVQANLNWFDELPNGIVLIIDEVWKIWKGGETSKDANEKHLTYLREHRHLVNEKQESTQIVLATQDLSDVAAYVRRLITTTYRHKKLDDLGMSNKFRIDIFQGAACGQNPEKEKPPINQINGNTYDPKIYQYYKSHTKTESSEIGAYENRMDERNNVFKNPRMYARLAFCAVLIGVAWWAVDSAFLSKVTPPEEDTAVQASTIATPQSQTMTIPKIPLSPQAKFLMNQEISIRYNNGVYPKIRYVFDLESGGQVAQMDNYELQRLGFTVTPISNCVAHIHFENIEFWPMCRSDDNSGFIDDFTQSTL